jgi:hypothetical protein
MRFIPFLFALLAGCATIQPAECPVIIGSGNFIYAGWQVISTNGGASFLSPTDQLWDGKPSTVTRLEWEDDPQTTGVWVGIEFQPQDQAGNTNQTIGLIGVKNTSLPPNLRFALWKGIVGGTFLGETRLQSSPDGSTEGWIAFDNMNLGSDLIIATFYNDAGSGSHPLHANDEFTIGEIYVGYKTEWKIKRNPQVVPANTGKVRISSNGTQSPIINPYVRQVKIDFSPLTQKQAFNSEADLQTTFRTIASSPIVAVLPFTRCDPAYGASTDTEDQQMVAKTAILCTFLNPPTITGDGDLYYDATMTVQESI